MDLPEHPLPAAIGLLERGKFAEAAQLAGEAVEFWPDHGKLWLIRAVAEHRQANYETARVSFETAALLIPLDGRMQCLLAECYAKTGHEKLARETLSFLADDPLCETDLLPVLTAGFGQIGDYERALSLCRLSAERQPLDAAPHFGAAYYLRRLGYPATAILPWASRAFDLEPGTSVYRTSLALLLVDAGRREEAYDLLRELPLDSATCRCRLRRMMSLFQAVGDHERWQECSDRLRSMQGKCE